MSEPMSWQTVQLKVSDLLPLTINPRKISDERKQKLIASLEKFNLAEIPAINKDHTIIAGHQRMLALQMIGRGEEVIDVRMPNRQLTLKELKEYNLISNTHAGEWDFELFDLHFADIDLSIVPVDISELRIMEDEPEEGGEREEDFSNFGGQADSYLNNTIRQIVLYFDVETHKNVLTKFKEIGPDYGIEDDSSALVLKLLEFYESNHKKD